MPPTQITKKYFDEQMTRIMDEITSVKGDVKKHKDYLFGNGEMGLDERMRNVERLLSTLIKLAWIVVTVVSGWVIMQFIEVVIT